MRDFAGQSFLDVWYSGLDLDDTWGDFVRSLSPKRRRRHADQVRRQLDLLVASYRHTLASDRRVLLDHFRLTDVAHKVVGGGSVGTRAWILLFEGAGRSDALLLQAKQAQASVLEPYAGASTAGSAGRRVVDGQRLIQASSDIFLGWVKGRDELDGGVDYYLRQLRDWKFSADIEQMRPSSLTLFSCSADPG